MTVNVAVAQGGGGAGSAPSKSATGSEPWLEPRMWERGARLYID